MNLIREAEAVWENHPAVQFMGCVHMKVMVPLLHTALMNHLWLAGMSLNKISLSSLYIFPPFYYSCQPLIVLKENHFVSFANIFFSPNSSPFPPLLPCLCLSPLVWLTSATDLLALRHLSLFPWF